MDISAVLGKFGFDIQLVIFNLFNFLLVFLLLKRFLFKGILKTIDNRQKLISESVENAERLESELKDARMKSDSIIAEAKKDANKIVSETRQEAAGLSEKLKLEAGEEVEGMLKKAKEQIEIEKTKAIKGVRKELADLIIKGTEKVTMSVVDNKVDSALIDELIDRK